MDQCRISLKFYIGKRYFVHFVDDAFVVGRQYLCAIVPISLVAIVFARVVAGRNVHARLAAEVTNSERDLRGGAQIVEKIDLDPIGGEDVGHRFCKQTTVVAAIVPYHDGNLLTIGEILKQIVGKSLCCSSYNINVHTIGSGSHDATESSRSKFQRAIESIDKRGFVFRFNHSLHGLFRLCIVERRVNPLLSCSCALCNEFFIFHTVLWQSLFVVCLSANLQFPLQISESSPALFVKRFACISSIIASSIFDRHLLWARLP